MQVTFTSDDLVVEGILADESLIESIQVLATCHSLVQLVYGMVGDSLESVLPRWPTRVFAAKLPHDGGAFYITDTMELGRPYYSKSWPLILHAATLWLYARGFNNNNNNNNDNDDKLKKKFFNIERFHLLLGICMEALCSSKTSESIENIETCPSALYTLFDSTRTRKVLTSDTALYIELCNVLHPLLLTRENYIIQLM
ncbi:hypothetical protein HCN44_004838 [Aphidius gifuensis]|uniref:Uncharacterized protein n=1 Tax=Aphidius gifuensis TaxID=684658 RepID=A0A835CR55_APHGI|nr:hypothetical protein HCN44_004838 [Aphidius gifuensis]